MKYTEKMSKKLNELLEKSIDAEKGYKNAAENVNNKDLKDFFNSRSSQRSAFARELRLEILSYGQIPDETGSAKGTAHRAWMDLKSFFSANNEEAILEECIRGEKAAIEEYNEILSEQATLPPTTTNLLIKQRDEIQKAINNVKWLEEVVS
ncbi:ferritin-like domain-containing protein [Abyssalbus ytuae]|uniref:PA2169 family four-helix-bundle protein n=1 Tax=Abyssalbus ytuae TaxID=2926907 RepID=A0A9E6ZP36_9FLAO|nr:PA2169 family four-helix-bundle protein [Abyssalbus ytuae]UOB16128.1 PA2169 family four-helix-bundle protein [Abyssalbus ytuae]